MLIKTIIAAGIELVASVAAQAAQTPSIAPGMEYFSSGTYQSGAAGGNTTRTTGTQGVVGNPNCPQPVEPGGIRPLNWSGPTGTQAGSYNLLANRPGTPAGYTRQTQQSGGQQVIPQQYAQTPGQRAMLRRNTGHVWTVNTQTANTGGGSAVNQRLQAALAQRNAAASTQRINAAAQVTGQRGFYYGTPRSTLGTGFGFGTPARSSNNRGLGQGQFGRR